MSGRRITALIAAAALFLWLGAAAASAGPRVTRVAYSSGTIVPIPAAIPHEPGDMVDRRILPDLRWIAEHFPIYITDGYSGPLPDGEHVGCNRCHVAHSDHYNGLAVDIVPLHGSSRCDASWRGITRLAHWAEPTQNHPVPPFRWVGYDGDAGHGCGNHLHLSWEHAAAPMFQLAEWVEVFPVKTQAVVPLPRQSHTGAGQRPASPRTGTGPKGGAAPKPGTAPPAGPLGGVSAAEPGGVSARGD